MNYIAFILFCTIQAVLLIVFVIVPHLRTERRARALLAAHPEAEQTSVDLKLHSMFAPGKQREIDAKVAEMQSQGWTFLRAMAAGPVRFFRSRGGGLTLYFIRTKV
jgi:hypothetical protein